jgi:phosphatidylinositol glycan class V
MTVAPNQQHLALLRRLSAASSLVFGLVLVASSRLPLFDASPLLVPDAHSSPLLRWDILHFLHIARHGYVFEHEWAFLPAAPWIIRYPLGFLEWMMRSTALSHLIFAIAVSVLASETVQTLYLLSLHHFKSSYMALLASLLAILPSSPATLLFVPYNEPFFTYLSYRGVLVLEGDPIH